MIGADSTSLLDLLHRNAIGEQNEHDLADSNEMKGKADKAGFRDDSEYVKVDRMTFEEKCRLLGIRPKSKSQRLDALCANMCELM